MIRRLLAFALAGCMVFESAPLTSYAAEPETQMVTESSAQTDESSDGTDESGEKADAVLMEEGSSAETASAESVDGGVDSSSDAENVSVPAGTDENLSEETNASTEAADVSTESVVESESAPDSSETEASIPLTKQEDGNYTFETADYKMSLKAEEGFRHLRFSASMEAKEGKTLASEYTVRVYYSEKGSDNQEEESFNLATWNNYTSTQCINVESNTVYKVYLVVSDNAKEEQTDSLELKTKPQDKDVVVYSTESTQNSITFDVETYRSYNCYYAPTDGSADEQSMYVSYNDWKLVKFNYLEPGKEYYFQFIDSNKKEVLTVKASTLESTAKVEYTAVAEAEGTDFGITLKANVSGYDGNANSASLYYTFTDAMGTEQSYWETINLNNNSGVTVAEDGTRSFSIETVMDCNRCAIEANTSYDINMWVQFGYSTVGPNRLDKATKTVQMPDAVYNESDITFTLTPSEDSASELKFAITIPSKEDGITHYVSMFYGIKGSLEKPQREMIGRPPYSGTLRNLRSGAEYDLVLFTGGVKIAKTYTCPETVKLTKTGDGEVNAFDLVRTWKAESAETLTGNYYLSLSIWNGISYETTGGAIALNEENGYQTEFKTMSIRKLNPDTDYDLQWSLRDSSNTLVYSCFESVHTPKANIAFEEEDKDYDAQKFKVTLDTSDISNFINDADNSFGAMSVYVFYKKEGNAVYRYASQLGLSDDNGYSTEYILNGLEPETKYDVSLRSHYTFSSGIEYAAATFTTSKDERKVTVTNTSAGLHNARLDYTLTGIPVTTDYGYIHCYIHEKNGEGDWERVNNNYFNSTDGHTSYFSIYRYNGEELKDATTYEYLIGFGSNYDTQMSKLEKTIKGEFTTAADTRTLSGAGVSAGYTIAKASVNFGGNDNNIYSHILLFYKAKGEETWNRYTSASTGSTAYSCNSTIEGLKSGTEYEYVFAISDDYYISSPDEVTKADRKVSGTFKTKESKYTLSFAKDDSKTTYNKAVVTVTAEGSTEDDRVNVILTLNDGHSSTVKLKQSTGYKGNVTFTNLLGGTEYTITGAELSVTEEGSTVTIAEIACDYKFTTKEAVAPTSIKLSHDKIGLNAAPTSYDGEGYNYKRLKVTTEPQSAAADFDWVSSDNAVVRVYNGVVYAVGTGTAVITVTSRYNKDIKATCEVIVKDYVVGAKKEDGTVEPYYYDTWGSVYKGGYVEGIGLYERNADGTLTQLSDYEVSSDKKGIVSWDSETGRLNVLAVGETRVTFEKTVAEGVSVTASFPLYVTAEGKGFGITGFTANNYAYPAVTGTEANSYILAYVPEITYRAIGEISPYHEFSPYDFTWSISDSNVATVSDSGVITPLKAGDVTLTVTPENFKTLKDNKYVQDKVEITLHIRELPGQGEKNAIYALANTAAKIGDVAFPEGWGEGWKWKYPDTPLVTNGVNLYSYPFEAVYSGTEKYPCEAIVNVYIGRITGAYINESGDSHAQTLEVSDGTQNEDKISLIVTPITQGSVSSDDYTIEVPEVNGLTIAPGSNKGYYDVKAQKAGNYTINAVIKAAASGTVLAKASYKIKAVEDKQAVSITFKPDETSGVTIDAAGKNIIFNKVEDKKDFTLTATVKDRSGQGIDTVLQWKTSDKSVAIAAPASKQDTHTAKITVKGEGHTVITATAKDARGLSVTLNLEVQNHRPRVDTSKATVNIAYEYDNTYGKDQALAAGSVEIVPVYNEYITNVKICDASGNVSTDLSAVSYSGKYLITPTATAKTGNYNCKLVVTTDTNTEYSYDLKVSVVDKAPSLSAKMAVAPNLFFKDSAGIINLTTSGDYRVDYVTWEDQSDGVDNGFSMKDYTGWNSKKSKNESYITVSQQSGIKITKGKLTDTGVDKGTLTVKLQAYKKVYAFKNFKIKYAYKKPKLVTMNASAKASPSIVLPSIGQNEGYFCIYDKTNEKFMYYGDTAQGRYYFDEYTWDAEESVELLTEDGSYWVDYVYNGKESTKKVNMTVDSEYWREPLKVAHTIKAVKPKAYLRTSQFVFNAAVSDVGYTYVYFKDTYTKAFSDIVIEGANPASKKMLDDDLFRITVDEYDNITVEQNNAKLMGATIPAGTYSYKVTPYYKNPENGESTKLNTLTLKVKVVNKPVTVKVSPKGTLDLTYVAPSATNEYKNYAVLVDPKLSNVGSECDIVDYKLVGEYSKYFELHRGRIWYANKYAYHYYITVNEDSKLKAGQAYKLAIEYTISTGTEDTFTVTSNTFTIKPKQSAPKIKVLNDNQTLYAGNDSMSRSYSLSVPSGYKITGADGSIDCNKDGNPDITVSGRSSLTVSITDKDAVVASASGKSYSIPVTVRLTGRDGISKNVKVTVKVKVKR